MTHEEMLQDTIDRMSVFKSEIFTLFAYKVVDKRLIQLGIDGNGQYVLRVNGKAHRSFTQPFAAADYYLTEKFD